MYKSKVETLKNDMTAHSNQTTEIQERHEHLVMDMQPLDSRLTNYVNEKLQPPSLLAI